MLQVVCRVRSNVQVAYLNSGIEASRVALYAKLQNMEPNTVRELLRYCANDAAAIIKEMKRRNSVLLSGYRTRFVEGNCLEATEHRLQILRDTKAGALPGKSLVFFDSALGLAIDLIPGDDGHAQERTLLAQALDTVEANELLVADWNFGVLSFLFGMVAKNSYFIIRQHQSTPFNSLSRPEFKCRTDTGRVLEEFVLLRHTGQELKIRRLLIKFKKPTRNNELEVAIFSNLPAATVTANQIAAVYQSRWGIETAFQTVEKYLNSELHTQGYPKAALFGFGIALVAFNLYAVVMAAIRAAYPTTNINDEVSDYDIAEEVSTTSGGMSLIVPETEWDPFIKGSISEVSLILLNLAGQLNLRKFKKHKRRPKEPPLPKEAFKGKPHVSTARLQAGTG